MLEVQKINTYYGETQVLFDVSLEIGAGEVVALLGQSGAGKTTTLRSILGLTQARSGTIRFDGKDITRAPTHEIARAGLGWVPDDRRVFPTLTVARNLQIDRMKRGHHAAFGNGIRLRCPFELDDAAGHRSSLLSRRSTRYGPRTMLF